MQWWSRQNLQTKLTIAGLVLTACGLPPTYLALRKDPGAKAPSEVTANEGGRVATPAASQSVPQAEATGGSAPQAGAAQASPTPAAAAPPVTAAKTSPAPIPPTPVTKTITLDGIFDATADGGGFDTGIRITAGSQLTIHARGTIVYGYEGGETGDCAGTAQTDPDGNRSVDGISCDRKFDPYCPAPAAAVGALIARIGANAWFEVGSNRAFRAQQSGTLWLAHNDYTPTDNSGHYEVVIQIS